MIPSIPPELQHHHHLLPQLVSSQLCLNPVWKDDDQQSPRHLELLEVDSESAIGELKSTIHPAIAEY